MYSTQWAGWRMAAGSPVCHKAVLTLEANPGILLSVLESRCNNEVLISADSFKGKFWFVAAQLELFLRRFLQGWLHHPNVIDLGIRRGNTHFLYCRQVWATRSKRLPTSGLAWIQVSYFTVISLYVGSTCGVFTLNILYFCNFWVSLYSHLIASFQVSSVRVI